MQNKPIPSLKLSTKDYQVLVEKLKKEYGMFIMLSWVSRRELGFTFRRHHPKPNQEQMYVDFYDEASRTYFMLKYFNYEN